MSDAAVDYVSELPTRVLLAVLDGETKIGPIADGLNVDRLDVIRAIWALKKLGLIDYGPFVRIRPCVRYACPPRINWKAP